MHRKLSHSMPYSRRLVLFNRVIAHILLLFTF